MGRRGARGAVTTWRSLGRGALSDSGGSESKLQVLAGLLSSEGPLPGVDTAVLSSCPHTVPLPHVCVLLSKDTRPEGRGPTPGPHLTHAVFWVQGLGRHDLACDSGGALHVSTAAFKPAPPRKPRS